MISFNNIPHPELILEAIKNLPLTMAIKQFKSNHDARFEFYTLLHDYLSSPGQVSPINFFSWYLQQLDKEEDKAPHLVLLYRKSSKSRNKASLRLLLNDCHKKVTTASADFAGAIAGWLPDDEERLLTASIKSDIRDQLQTVIRICEEKRHAAMLIKEAISQNAVLFFVIAVAHYVIYDFLYASFITSPAIVEPGYDTSRFTKIDEAYLIYHWFTYESSWLIMAIGLFSTGALFKYLINNWNSSGMFLREQYIDFLPPFSIAKLSSQYSIIMITDAFMRIGYGFYDAVSECKKGASNYEKYQIDKILSNRTDQSHKAFNTFFMGSFGNMIESRAENIRFEEALSSLLPSIKQKREAAFRKIVSISLLLTIKPALWISILLALWPVVAHMSGIVTGLSEAASGMQE